MLFKLHHPRLLPYPRGHKRRTPVPAEIALFLSNKMAVGKLELDLHVGGPSGLVREGGNAFGGYRDGGEMDA